MITDCIVIVVHFISLRLIKIGPRAYVSGIKRSTYSQPSNARTASKFGRKWIPVVCFSCATESLFGCTWANWRGPVQSFDLIFYGLYLKVILWSGLGVYDCYLHGSHGRTSSDLTPVRIQATFFVFVQWHVIFHDCLKAY